MGLVTILNLSLTVLRKTIFDRVGFQVEPGDRIGLVGPNGSGKTSLLRLIAGEMSPDDGEIRIPEGTRIGFLRQDIQESLSGTLVHSIIDSVPGRIRLRDEITKIEQVLKKNSHGKEQEELAASLAQKHQAIADLDVQFPPHRAEKILIGLGFKPNELGNSIESLSGGWKMRAALGSLLYQNPDLLLLDEPTNHLDIPSVRWLEQFLHDFRGALILVCHDRDFLNRQIGRVISFEPEGLRFYNGTYDLYLQARQEERKILEAKARNQEQRIKEAKKFIERFRAKASKARQAQSKIKLMKKMELVKSHRKEKAIRFSFPQVPRSGKVVLNIEGVSKGYNGNPLYEDIHLKVLRGERVAIIGPNGSGKTTLLRMVANEIDPDRGLMTSGHNVSLSYYAQHHSDMLNRRRTIIEEVYQVVPHQTVGFVRGVCGAFLFSGEDVDKTIGILSGGEKARVCLAKILVNPGNLLVMDEPTNHLDIVSSEILIDALMDFQGTLLFVSHNQSFVNRLATKIWDIKGRGILEYPGTLYENYDHLARSENVPKAASDGHAETPKVQGQDAPIKSRPSRKMLRRQKAEKRRLVSATLQPLRDELLRLENRISKLEKRERDLEKRLAEPEIIRDKNEYFPLLDKYNDTKEELEKLLLQWEYKQEELASTKKDLEQ